MTHLRRSVRAARQDIAVHGFKSWNLTSATDNRAHWGRITCICGWLSVTVNDPWMFALQERLTAVLENHVRVEGRKNS